MLTHLISNRKVQGQAVTRWEELQQAALFHVELSATLQFQTHFRLLNHPGDAIGVQEFTIGNNGMSGAQELAQELRVARNIIQRTKPAGVTPLTDPNDSFV